MNKQDSINSMNDAGHLENVGGLQVSPEVFEKLFLSPQNAVKGSLRGTFALPTPIAVVGFVVALSPLSADLMMWRGAGGLGAASVPAYYFFGGLCLFIGGLGEFLEGNTFPMVVFWGYGAWFITYATTLVPYYGAVIPYATDPTNPASGATSAGFYASFGFLVIFMAVLSFLFLICSLRTNLVFVLVFVAATMGFGFVGGGLFTYAKGNLEFGTLLVKAGGGSFFGAAMCGWYLLASIMFQVLDLPINLPVFDLSGVIKGHSDLRKRRAIA